jgi:hypothetical protein
MATEQTIDNGRRLPLISCLHAPDSMAGCLQNYTKQLVALLQGHLHWQPVGNAESPGTTKPDLRQYDLVILNEAEWLSLRQPSSAAFSATQGQHYQPSLLLVREPCWPLQRLLLIIRGEATDKTTIEWGVHLAQLARCTVTLLVVAPPITYGREQFISQALMADTIPGRHIRHALHQLAANQITGVLKLSHYGAERQVQDEVTSSDYDLIILGSEPPGRLFSWRLDSLLMPLLQWTRQPVLIAGTTSPWRGSTP